MKSENPPDYRIQTILLSFSLKNDWSFSSLPQQFQIIQINRCQSRAVNTHTHTYLTQDFAVMRYSSSSDPNTVKGQPSLKKQIVSSSTCNLTLTRTRITSLASVLLRCQQPLKEHEQPPCLTERDRLGSLLDFRCSIHLQHLVTISFSCLPKPGHQTEAFVRRLHLTIPSCPSWILSRISSLIDDGIRRRESLRRSPCP